MGQQQLFLVTLGALAVAIGILVGLQIRDSRSVQANQDALVHDVTTIASRALEWYRKPVQFGGGSRNWTRLTSAPDPLAVLQLPQTTPNGKFKIAPGASGGITITGVGLEDGDGDGKPVTVVLTITDFKPGNVAFSSR